LRNDGEILPRGSRCGLRNVTHLCRASRQLGREGPGQAHIGKSPAALGNEVYSHLAHIHKRPLGVSPNHDSSCTIPSGNGGERKARFGNRPIVTIIPTPTLHQCDRSSSRSSPGGGFRKPLPIPLNVRILADSRELELQHGIGMHRTGLTTRARPTKVVAEIS
ncbi:hypothetical protein C7212DRAFT_230488, partial [Tuber magnatum]